MSNLSWMFAANWPILIHMKDQNRSAIFALAAAGTLWGLNVPLTKLALGWLGPGLADRASVRGRRAGAGACRSARAARSGGARASLVSGAMGFGAVIVLQNAGIERTSVSHAAVSSARFRCSSR